MQDRQTQRFLDAVELLERAADLRELLWMSVLDLDEARDEVETLKRMFREHRSRWSY